MMELLVKVGGRQDTRHWRDGQIIDIRPDGFHKGNVERKNHCVLTLPDDYWQVRGSTDWKSTKTSVLNLKKYLVAVDSEEKYPWERTTQLEEKRIRRRDYFIDFKLLLDLKIITLKQFDLIYNKDKDPGLIYINQSLDQLLRLESKFERLTSKYSLSTGTIASGTFSIGDGLNYSTVTAFEADIAAQLTGDLTGEHADEETSISADITFDTDTNTYLLKLTAASGAEHTGGVYGNGARINFGLYDDINFNETNDGDFDDLEVSKLAFDISGAGNQIAFVDGGDGGLWTANRCLVKGDGSSRIGVDIGSNAKNLCVMNCILYGISGSYGISLYSTSGNTHTVLNNTVVGCNYGIHQDNTANDGTKVVRNNLCQNNTTDFVDDGGGFGTTSNNISEDATSPDAAYDNTDVHTNSVFKDYANDDYRLDSAGDATNLAIVDDGVDLSGTFTDDIEGQTRDTWYIGASEIVEAGGWTGKVMGVTNPSKINGIAVANISKVNGI